jgi:hypothetical protein
MRWGESSAKAWVSWCNNHSASKDVERMGKRERNATPREFRDLLLSIASSVFHRESAA